MEVCNTSFLNKIIHKLQKHKGLFISAKWWCCWW